MSCLILYAKLRVALEPVVENEKNGGANKQVVEEEAADGNKEKPVNEREEKEPEEKV